MECWQCGRQVRQGAKLCIYCGADLTHNGGAFEPEPPAQRGSSYVENESEELPRPGRGSSRGGSRAVPRDPFDDPRAPAPGAPRSSRRDDYGEYGQGRSSSRANGPDERRRSSSSGNRERSGYRSDWQGDASRDGSPRANRRPEGRAGGHGRSGGHDDAYADDRRGEYDDAYDAYDARERHGGRGGRDGYGRGQPDPYANSPLDDSWNLPALAGQASEEGWAVGGGPGWGDVPGRLSPAGSPPGRGAAGGRSTRQRGSGSGRTAVIALVVAIALAMIAGGVVVGPRLLARLGGTAGGASAAHPFTTYTPGPTPTPIAKFKEFVSAQSHFVVNYPADWSSPYPQNDTSHGQYDYIDTLSKADPYMRVIVEQAQSFDAATDQQIIQGEVAGGQTTTTGLTFTATASGAASTIVGGEQWTRKEFDVTQANQPKLHMVILSCHHAGHGYALLLAAQSTGFAQTYTSTFQKVLSSFRFST